MMQALNGVQNAVVGLKPFSRSLGRRNSAFSGRTACRATGIRVGSATVLRRILQKKYNTASAI